MMIVMSIAIVIVSAAIVILLLKQGNTDAIVEKNEQEINSKASETDLEAVKTRLVTQISDTDKQIREITAKLEEIAKDIKRLDERSDADHKNLVDIRQRYILYKEPVAPVEESEPAPVGDGELVDKVRTILSNFEVMRDE